MSDPTTYRIEVQQNRAIVALLPALNDVAWADIEKIGGDVIAQLGSLTAPALLVDLTALNYMGSSQVALVVRMFKSVKERGGKLVVANKHPLVMEVLTLAGLNKLWTIVDSRDAGLKLLGGPTSVETGGSTALVNGLGFGALVVAVIALLAIITPFSRLPTSTAIAVELGAAAVAFLCGLMALLKGSRTVGACILIGSVAILLAGVFSLGTMKSRPGTVEPDTTVTPSAPDPTTSPSGDAVGPAAPSTP